MQMNHSSDWRSLITSLYLDCVRGVGDREDALSTSLSSESSATEESLFCPRTFDGYLCWPRTIAGRRISQPCPSFVTGFDATRRAHKTCMANGKWFSHPESGNEWSNYTTCVDLEDLRFRRSVNNLFVIGYSMSLAALVLSLALLIGFRALRCTRIRIHTHLFASLALACVSWLMWYKLIVEQPEVIAQHAVLCTVLHLVIHYLMLTNYFWMFCEGVHLLLVLVVVFLKDDFVLRCFYGIGWILPVFILGIYATVRLQGNTDNSQCWIEEDSSLWIITVPVSVSLISSLGFLIYVVRILVIKIRSNSTPKPPRAFQKALRATLILFPLFGLQHILLPLRPDPGTSTERTYQIFSAIVISCQGLCVSFLFCFANQEVITCVRSLLHRLMPSIFAARNWEIGPPATQTRDVVV